MKQYKYTKKQIEKIKKELEIELANCSTCSSISNESNDEYGYNSYYLCIYSPAEKI